MLGIREMAVVNAEFARRGANKSPRPYDHGEPTGDYIIVVYTRGQGVTTFYDRGGHYLTDRSKVNGWRDDEMSEAMERVQDLQQTLHTNSVAALDRR